MATDFDDFPVYDALIKKDTPYLSDEWVTILATFYQTLITYLTSGGIFIPVLTMDQRNKLQNPQFGQMIYNSSINLFQGYQGPNVGLGNVTGWYTFTTTLGP